MCNGNLAALDGLRIVGLAPLEQVCLKLSAPDSIAVRVGKAFASAKASRSRREEKAGLRPTTVNTTVIARH
jgi:hypothetical protein